MLSVRSWSPAGTFVCKSLSQLLTFSELKEPGSFRDMSSATSPSTLAGLCCLRSHGSLRLSILPRNLSKGYHLPLFLWSSSERCLSLWTLGNGCGPKWTWTCCEACCIRSLSNWDQPWSLEYQIETDQEQSVASTGSMASLCQRKFSSWIGTTQKAWSALSTVLFSLHLRCALDQ